METHNVKYRNEQIGCVLPVVSIKIVENCKKSPPTAAAKTTKSNARITLGFL